MSDPTITPEFSHVVALDDLPDDGYSCEIAAKPDERAALAVRFGMVSLERLEARVGLKWLETGTVLSVTGAFSADVVQSCVVSLEPVAATVEEAIDIVFARDIEDAADIVNPDEAEPLEGETLDVGEIVAEELSLALNPYPRHPDLDPTAVKLGPGATLSSDDAPEKRSGRSNPFEVLAEIKPKL